MFSMDHIQYPDLTSPLFVDFRASDFCCVCVSFQAQEQEVDEEMGRVGSVWCMSAVLMLSQRTCVFIGSIKLHFSLHNNKVL